MNVFKAFIQDFNMIKKLVMPIVLISLILVVSGCVSQQTSSNDFSFIVGWKETDYKDEQIDWIQQCESCERSQASCDMMYHVTVNLKKPNLCCRYKHDDKWNPVPEGICTYTDNDQLIEAWSANIDSDHVIEVCCGPQGNFNKNTQYCETRMLYKKC